MHCNLASGSAAVVAGGADSGRRVQAVIGLGTNPRGGGLMAIFTNGLAIVNGRRRLAGSSVQTARMAGRALRGQRDIGVESARVPAGVTTLVATVAIGNGHARQAGVGDVISRLAISRRERATVAGRTLIGYRSLAVVPLGGLPARHAMTLTQFTDVGICVAILPVAALPL